MILSMVSDLPRAGKHLQEHMGKGGASSRRREMQAWLALAASPQQQRSKERKAVVHAPLAKEGETIHCTANLFSF